MKRIVVFTGAGVSADSGLATFRDSDGLWADYRIEDVCTPEALAHNRATVIEFYNKRRREMLAAEPNAGHRAIAELEREKYPLYRRELQNDRNISALRRMRIKKQWWRMESSAAFDARVEELRARKAELRRKYRYEARLVQEGIDRSGRRPKG